MPNGKGLGTEFGEIFGFIYNSGSNTLNLALLIVKLASSGGFMEEN